MILVDHIRWKGEKMNDITGDLVTILEELYAKEKEIIKAVTILEGEEGGGPGILIKSITEVERTLIKYLGGDRSNWSFFGELSGDNPFLKLEYGNITRDDFINQLRRGVELDLTPEAYMNGECSAEDIII